MASFDINDEFVRRLARLLDETGLTEIELAEGQKRIRVTRAVAPAAMIAPAPVAAVPMATAAAPAAAAPSAKHPGSLTSPMVGTAYVGPDPTSPPFVRVGDAVKQGQTVLIIEAMKVMNPIKAHKGGVVSQILVTDAQPVEFGEVLLVIE